MVTRNGPSRLPGFLLHFASWREQVEATNGEGEYDVVKGCPKGSDHEKPEGVVRLREENDVINEAMREGETVDRRRKARNRSGPVPDQSWTSLSQIPETENCAGREIQLSAVLGHLPYCILVGGEGVCPV